jgi:preprotein translocase subunit YajC
MFESVPMILAQEDAPPAETPAAGPGPEQGQASEGQPADGPGGETPSDQAPPGGLFGGGSTMWIWMILLMVVFFFIMTGGQRREKKKRQQMLAALNKNDKIQTIGGIMGTVVEVRDDEVVVKVDEASNTRLRFGRGAIQQVLTEKES